LEVDDRHQRRLVSHGEFITVAADARRPVPDGWSQPLVEVVHDLINYSA
jgi:hypothetical protein